MNAPHHDAIADCTPVTVWMKPAQAVQFEVLLASLREGRPDMDEDKLSDEIFARGLKAFGCQDEAREAAEREAATIEADEDIAMRAYIDELRTELAEARAISTPAAIRHLQELMTGTGACLAIEDGELLVEVVMEPSGEAIDVQPDDLVEMVDALTVIQNFREQP